MNCSSSGLVLFYRCLKEIEIKDWLENEPSSVHLHCTDDEFIIGGMQYWYACNILMKIGLFLISVQFMSTECEDVINGPPAML